MEKQSGNNCAEHKLITLAFCNNTENFPQTATHLIPEDPQFFIRLVSLIEEIDGNRPEKHNKQNAQSNIFLLFNSATYWSRLKRVLLGALCVGA